MKSLKDFILEDRILEDRILKTIETTAGKFFAWCCDVDNWDEVDFYELEEILGGALRVYISDVRRGDSSSLARYIWNNPEEDVKIEIIDRGDDYYYHRICFIEDGGELTIPTMEMYR